MSNPSQPAEQNETWRFDYFLESIYKFNKIGQIVPPGPAFNADRTTFYTGMQCEEFAEKLMAIAEGAVTRDERETIKDTAHSLKRLGEAFKAGLHMGSVLRADRKELLDGDIDIAVVTLGSAMYQTPFFREAAFAVTDANLAKVPGGVAVRHPITNKIEKPAGWKEADLTPFLILASE